MEEERHSQCLENEYEIIDGQLICTNPAYRGEVLGPASWLPRKPDNETVTNSALWGSGLGTMPVDGVVQGHGKSDQYYQALTNGNQDFVERELRTWICKIVYIPQRPALKEYGHRLTDQVARFAQKRLAEVRLSSLIGLHEIGLTIRYALKQVEALDPTAQRYMNESLLSNLIDGNLPSNHGGNGGE